MTSPQQGTMTAAEYSAAQQEIASQATAFILSVVQPFQLRGLSAADWQRILAFLYPFVEQWREESATLAREFLDSQRIAHVGAPLPTYLAEYQPDWFEEAMRPAFQAMRQPNTPLGAVSQTVMRAVKEIENGGRRTLLRAVQDDPQAVGWARIATGRETCGFCLMLVSRGPVYKSAKSAGLNAGDESATQLLNNGDAEALDELTTRWHPGCDCKVVPVYDRSNWPGRDAFLRAQKLWSDATRGYRGRDALNALRRAIDEGDVSPGDIAVAA